MDHKNHMKSCMLLGEDCFLPFETLEELFAYLLVFANDMHVFIQQLFCSLKKLLALFVS